MTHNQRLKEARNVEDLPKVSKITYVDPAGMLKHYMLIDEEESEPIIIDGVFQVGYQISMDIDPNAVVEFYGYYKEDYGRE